MVSCPWAVQPVWPACLAGLYGQVGILKVKPVQDVLEVFRSDLEFVPAELVLTPRLHSRWLAIQLFKSFLMGNVQKNCRKLIFGARGSSVEFNSRLRENVWDIGVVHAWPEDCGNRTARSDRRMDTLSVNL